jgi:hypothetical protein
MSSASAYDAWVLRSLSAIDMSRVPILKPWPDSMSVPPRGRVAEATEHRAQERRDRDAETNHVFQYQLLPAGQHNRKLREESTRPPSDLFGWAPMRPPAGPAIPLDPVHIPWVQTPNGPRMPPGDSELAAKAVVVIEFKRGRRVKAEAPTIVACGAYVMVQLPHGTDCGLVVQMTVFAWDGSVEITEVEGYNGALSTSPFEDAVVVRAARPSEVETLFSSVPHLEQQALNLFRMRSAAHGFSDIRVHDCEIQWDMQRITFYYDSDALCDFTQVVRELQRVYMTKVMLCNTNVIAVSAALERTATDE